MNHFIMGFRALLPIISGTIPFGLVMGAVFSEAKLSLFQAMLMNVTLYAGASQLATVNLMSLKAATAVVVATGLIINLRFLLYSAAMSPYLRESPGWIRFFCAFTLTDQGYSAMSANQDKFSTNAEAVQFYMGSAVCMFIAWHASVIAGYIFGNFAPASWSLDYAVPLSFAALLIPTLKNQKYVVVALFSSVVSLLLNGLPLKTGLIVTALLSIILAAFLIRRKA